MKFKVFCKSQILWYGRDKKNQYFLFRARIQEVKQLWELSAYVLLYTNAKGAGIYEIYKDFDINPGKGIRANQVVSLEFDGSKIIFPWKKVHVEDVDEYFAEYCERGGHPLLHRAILV